MDGIVQAFMRSQNTICTTTKQYICIVLWFGDANFGLAVYPQSPPNGVGCLLRSLYLGHYACFVEGRHLVVAFDSHVLNHRGISEFLIVSILALLLNILPSFRTHCLPSFVSLESRGHSLPLCPLFIQLHDNVQWFERSLIVQIMLQTHDSLWKSWMKDTICRLGGSFACQLAAAFKPYHAEYCHAKRWSARTNTDVGQKTRADLEEEVHPEPVASHCLSLHFSSAIRLLGLNVNPSTQALTQALIIMQSSGSTSTESPLSDTYDKNETLNGAAGQHPFARTTARLELIPPSTSVDGIDVEEESRLYDDLCRTYEDETDDFTRSNTPVKSGGPSIQNPKLKKSKSVRPHSFLAAESIFSADIFLSDNTGPSSSSSSPLFAQDVTITGWTTVGDRSRKGGPAGGLRGAGAYIAYDCAIVTREGTTMHILKRYTAFEELNDRLKRTLPPPLLPFLPTLPPKAPLARFRPTFLDSRRKLLQFWLASVLLHPEIGGRDVVRDWVLS
ncbi:hypothetical protein BDN70DRAFT_898149 [Pholiota conissans]|uniref:Endosomal/vacuolar adapter protein YPT35 n=1 Tax=Pholiota conissans TaxID=109636 RepID=A0A9P5YUQ2_9AGAR|nr:hypothetical protein BDN70DRAFT_898149 [Pholiota conissans]